MSEVLKMGALRVLKRLRGEGFLAWWVGGCVRDHLMGLPIKDIDIATNATPDRIATLFPEVRLVGAAFGVCLVVEPEGTYEVATFRRDGHYIDHRHPESVSWGTPEEDARRRDFTVNSLFHDPETGETLDFVGGLADLKARLLRAVGDPQARFREDALRLLRAVRFAARLDFRVEPDTWAAICRNRELIRAISPERVRDELTRMLQAAKPSRAFRLLDESGLLAIVLPEIAALKGVEQGRRFHPEGDVFEHTMLCLDNLDRRDGVTCWAMLLHDIGKPATFARGRDGRITFYDHENVGAGMARAVCSRLRFSNDDARRISDIVARHMRFIHAPQWNPSTMRRFLAADTIEGDLAVHRSDILSSSGDLAGWERVSSALESLRAAEEEAIPKPLITGEDLIEAGWEPGPHFKELLARAADAQMNGEVNNKKDALDRLRADFQKLSKGDTLDPNGA